MCKYRHITYKGICMMALGEIILLAHFVVLKYNSNKILRFLRGGYYGTSGGEFHI